MSSKLAKSISIKEWIEAEGVSTIAKALGVTISCVGHWKRGLVLPDTRQFRKILKLTDNRVSIDKSYAEHFATGNNKNRWVK